MSGAGVKAALILSIDVREFRGRAVTDETEPS